MNRRADDPWTSLLVPQSQFETKASGYILLNDVEVAHTLQCVHCQAHFVSIRGSGHIRGFCVRCQGTTCGRTECDPCRPWEQQMEQIEKAFRQLILP